MTTHSTPTARLQVEPVTLDRRPDGTFDLTGTMQALEAHALLETQPQSPADQQWSYVVIHAPVRLLFDGVRAQLVPTGTTTSSRLGPIDLGPDPFVALDRVCEMTEDVGSAAGTPPFTHGLVGTLSYDLGRSIEELAVIAADDRGQAWMDLVVATAVIAVDHVRDQAFYCAYHDPTTGWPPPPTRSMIEASLGPHGAARPPTATRPGDADGPGEGRRRASSTLTRAEHAEAVGTVLDHIAAGDVFQVNLSHRLSAPWADDDISLYAALRDASPAPYLALYRCGDGTSIVSVSPETYLLVRGRTVETRPIKGTRARGGDPESDRRACAALQASAKDRAENVMVVDMERNDLGRVCVPGTVEVPRLLEVEAHPTVWQLVSTVTGELQPDVTWGKLVAGTFPCGSVTGAPKVRAMQVIESLEPVRRGWYCGAVGLFGHQHVSLSVAIRTAVLNGGQVDYAAGGGIVADSDIDAEWDETLAKAAAFLEATRAELVTR